MKPEILEQIDTYSDVIGKLLPLLERIVLFFQGLRNDKVRAKRLRYQSARLYRLAKQARNNGHGNRAIRLFNKSQDKWEEAQKLEHVDARTIALSDIGQGTV